MIARRSASLTATPVYFSFSHAALPLLSANREVIEVRFTRAHWPNFYTAFLKSANLLSS